jgi:hypothetical protein
MIIIKNRRKENNAFDANSKPSLLETKIKILGNILIIKSMIAEKSQNNEYFSEKAFFLKKFRFYFENPPPPFNILI